MMQSSRTAWGAPLLWSMLMAIPAAAAPVISEVAWSGDPITDSATDEWIEIHNPSVDAVCDLSAFKLIGAGSSTNSITLPALPLAGGDFFIVQNTSTVPSSDATRSFVTPSISLLDGGEPLCLCPVAATVCDQSCDIANPAGALWFQGVSTGGARQTMERTAANNDGALLASWLDGTPSSPGTASFAGAIGTTTACNPVGEGEGEGEGEAPVVDPGDTTLLSPAPPYARVGVEVGTGCTQTSSSALWGLLAVLGLLVRRVVSRG